MRKSGHSQLLPMTSSILGDRDSTLTLFPIFLQSREQPGRYRSADPTLSIQQKGNIMVKPRGKMR